MLPPTKSVVAGLPRALRDAARNTTAGFELYPAPLGRSAPYETVAEIEAGIAFDSDGPSRYAMVFPDGVAKVQIWSQSSPQTGPVTAPVSHNVAAFSSSIQSWEPGREIWYGPRGDVIRRISDAASCKHTLNDCH